MNCSNYTMTIIIFLWSPAAPGDYTDDAQIFIFSQAATKFSFNITIADDDILEETEQFFISAELLSADAGTVTIYPDQSVVTIEDGDSKYHIQAKPLG
jgi:hypothetical protein